jgi:argininosuccinate lyase
MPHTREDVQAAKSALIQSLNQTKMCLNQYMAVLKSVLATVENTQRAVAMFTAAVPEVDVLTLHDTPESVATKASFVRGLAEKISNVTSPQTPPAGNGS